MNNPADKTDVEKGTPHIIVEIIEYLPHAVVSKTIIKKTTGNVTVSSLDAGEEVGEKTLAFDNYIQIIDGAAEISINDKIYTLNIGEGITIPAHAKHCFNAAQQFKMLSTIIKSGYESWTRITVSCVFSPALENLYSLKTGETYVSGGGYSAAIKR